MIGNHVFCKNCGTKMMSEDVHCSRCGKLSVSAMVCGAVDAPAVDCPVCHISNYIPSRFCRMCGTTFSQKRRLTQRLGFRLRPSSSAPCHDAGYQS